MSIWDLNPTIGQSPERDRAEREAYRMAMQARQDQSIFGQRKERETMLEKLKNLQNGRFGAIATVEELMELAAYARTLVNEYEEHGIALPRWLHEVTGALARQIQVRHQADLEEGLRKAERELEELRSQEEKRAAKEKEVEALRKALAGP